MYLKKAGHGVAQSGEALPKGRWLDSRCYYWIFHWRNTSGRNVTLGSTQLLIEMSTKNISWVVKAAGAKGWQPYHVHVPTVMKTGIFNLLEPSQPLQACNRDRFSFDLKETKYVCDT
jgi:predicted membrane-bound spermidine synthase